MCVEDSRGVSVVYHLSIRCQCCAIDRRVGSDWGFLRPQNVEPLNLTTGKATPCSMISGVECMRMMMIAVRAKQ